MNTSKAKKQVYGNHFVWIFRFLHPEKWSTVLVTIRDGSVGPYLFIESILLKYPQEILQPLLHLSVHIMEGRVKILEIYPKSEEIISFYPQFSCIYRYNTVVAIMFSRTAMFWLLTYFTYPRLSCWRMRPLTASKLTCPWPDSLLRPRSAPCLLTLPPHSFSMWSLVFPFSVSRVDSI